MRDRRWAVALAGSYVVGLGVLVSAPWGWELNRFTVWLYVIFRYYWPLAPDWTGPAHYGIALNVVLFVPLGAMLVALTRRPGWAVLGCLAGSALIELVQWRWLEREGGWTDVVANTLGAVIGAVVVSLVTRDRSRPGAGSDRARRR